MNLLEQQSNEFIPRHIGPNEADTRQMLKKIGAESLDQLIRNTVPAAIRMNHPLNIPAAMLMSSPSMATTACPLRSKRLQTSTIANFAVMLDL